VRRSWRKFRRRLSRGHVDGPLRIATAWALIEASGLVGVRVCPFGVVLVLGLKGVLNEVLLLATELLRCPVPW
jgi:hypothetical protein